jgi:hypothetical protein
VRRALLAIGLGCALAGCQKASDATDAKRMPKPPPVKPVEPLATFSIPIEKDGRPAGAIDSARLKAHPPDFQDRERQAWKLVTLLGADADRPDVEVAAVGEDNVAVVFPRPSGSADPQPVLMLNRRGEAIATLVSPTVPFPGYHGEGGRLARPGDPRPHVAPVVKLRLTTLPPQKR